MLLVKPSADLDVTRFSIVVSKLQCTATTLQCHCSETETTLQQKCNNIAVMNITALL